MLVGMTIPRATQFLKNVIDKRECVTATKFNNGRGRHAQAKQHGQVLAFWPQKICRVVLKLVANAANNAEVKGLDRGKLIISAAQANPAPRIFKRTFGAHGRINPFMKSPAHLFVMVEEKQAKVPVPAS